MSVEAMAIALHHSRAKGATKLVLVGIANHLGDGGSWPSMTTLAKYGNVSRDQARKCVQQLEKLHEVERDVNGGGSWRIAEHERPNRYEFKLKCPGLPTCDGSLNHRDPRRHRVPLLTLEAAPEAVDNTPPRNGGGVAAEGTPPSQRRDEPPLNQDTTADQSPHLGNRARASCPSGIPEHRWNRRHRFCADCDGTAA